MFSFWKNVGVPKDRLLTLIEDMDEDTDGYITLGEVRDLLKKYGKASMACYVAMGWLIVLALRPTIETVGLTGFLWLLAGGLAYTVGAVLYGIGKKKRYFHSVFHLFVLLGSLLQAVCILFYVL